jgi:UDP-N-acetylmuramate dehydrogenase
MDKRQKSEENWAQWFKNHASSFTGALLFDEPLARYTYYQIGGPVRILAAPKSLEDLKWLKEAVEATGVPFFILGKGSNLLVSDQGFEGLVIRTHQLNLEVQTESERDSGSRAGEGFVLRTGGSVLISSLLRKTAQEGWSGLEFWTGIPGSVGGAIIMNAGTHLGESQDRLTRVEAYSLERGTRFGPSIFTGEDLKFQYRKNLFLPPGHIIWSADWRMDHVEPEKVKNLIDETLKRRKSTQPIDYPSCGSVFKNPKSSGKNAWQVIDQLGLRGYVEGKAQFSEKHPNFIINLGGAKASDVLALIRLAQSRAAVELGIELEEEVIFVGDDFK